MPLSRRPVALTLPNRRDHAAHDAAQVKDFLVLRQYELGEILGQGSTSVVRRAALRSLPSDAQPSSPLVVKTYKTDDPEMVRVARREFEILTLLQGHPNIMVCKELLVDTAAGRVDLVLGLSPGESLSEIVARQGALPEEKARPILVKVLRAVHWCHSHRVVHRDVKPDNIIVSPGVDGTPNAILVDFNTAVRLGTDAVKDPLGGGLTPTGDPEFLAPESGDSTCSEMGDVWATGLCLHSMVFGKLPSRRRRYNLEKDCSKHAHISKDCVNLLKSLLQKKVAARCLSADALAHPWCRLSIAEVYELFEEVVAQPPSFPGWHSEPPRTLSVPQEEAAHGVSTSRVKTFRLSRVQQIPWQTNPYVAWSSQVPIRPDLSASPSTEHLELALQNSHAVEGAVAIGCDLSQDSDTIDTPTVTIRGESDSGSSCSSSWTSQQSTPNFRRSHGRAKSACCQGGTAKHDLHGEPSGMKYSDFAEQTHQAHALPSLSTLRATRLRRLHQQLFGDEIGKVDRELEAASLVSSSSSSSTTSADTPEPDSKSSTKLSL